MASFTHYDIHSQSKQIIYLPIFLKKTQRITAEACGISERSIQNIIAEVKKYKNDDTPRLRSLFASPKKSYKQKVITDIDDFNVDLVRRTVHEFYDKVVINHIWQNDMDSEVFKVPTGKGGRLIVCHAGAAKFGFISGSKLIFWSKNDRDYLSQMNSQIFHVLFQNMLQLFEEPCVIVMDAPYHSWLTELEKKVKMAKSREKRYQLDELAYQMGHEVIRLPPYHCQYNPNELIWAQVKGEIATKTTFKMADVEKLMHEAIDAVTKENWEKCVRH
ncbi:Ribonuclease H-like domain [Cinara cedri]|uniref:Ribonuclease H-like domain n=1 Tax=Cinara cedri TaxID=506608 RepID=A0A5E4N9J8_9HEMI|nr:Ribonuclease H-like domain [Cinara cedri]